MQVTKLISYMYMGSDQYPVDVSFIQSTELINMVKNAEAGTFERNFRDLHELSPDNIFKQNFNGLDIYKAIRKCQFYAGIANGQTLIDTDIRDSVNHIMGFNIKDLLIDKDPPTTYQVLYPYDNLVAEVGTAYNISVNLGAKGIGLYKMASGTGLIQQWIGLNLTTNTLRYYVSNNSGYMYLSIYPDDLIVDGYVNPAYAEGVPSVYISLNYYLDSNHDYITRIEFGDVTYYSGTDIYNFLANINFPDYTQQVDDPGNPYGDPGTSGPGGGDGDYGNPDEVDPTSVPDLPSISASSTGFITIYNPSSANLSALGSFLWSNMFDIDTFKKLYTDPMDCIISLGIVPCLPNSAGTQNIKFGNIDTGINCSVLSTQYAKVDCGSVDIRKYVGSFMDYSPYVKVSLFLPYIGFIHLGTDDIMGGSINVTYHVDVLSGDCIAFISHSSKGVLYSYTGNCLTNVPVTAANYANSLRNYYEAVTGIIPSTANGAMSGGAAGAAGGAINGALSAASNIILNTKPDFQRSGSLGGSSGIMGVQKPFIIIERPNISVPNKVQHYMGQTSNITANLGGLSGMTIVEAVHLEGISCTTEELSEIEALLKGGVIL